jgi:hypothetical protein
MLMMADVLLLVDEKLAGMKLLFQCIHLLIDLFIKEEGSIRSFGLLYATETVED